ncbi:SDR family NAD(P)-dependent oxidoreductase [Aestuariicoccus sp. MJ-SS9]|uniref:SDR family NAD(P)-dependent oxidoreductase n=1 Tax=Aestuariicoccus sp. MJ-SS9 TaxID=3079855 RepID=UPI002914C8B5|nr:SDR family NAD(P)-dependent oxidoreductase [Aestuariicoccus sp. MJ-SS9]MDU8914104.1 SDR family oxidoreductase [Aestuariicoccus sp. MJ-SS9]
MIVGFGDGLSAALARNLAADHALTRAECSGDQMAAVAAETGAEMVLLDATNEDELAGLIAALPASPPVVIDNSPARVRGPIVELSADDVRRAVEVTAIGAFLTAKHAAKRMLAAEPIDGTRGTILFTGASARVKGFPLALLSSVPSSPTPPSRKN